MKKYQPNLCSKKMEKPGPESELALPYGPRLRPTKGQTHAYNGIEKLEPDSGADAYAAELGEQSVKTDLQAHISADLEICTNPATGKGHPAVGVFFRQGLVRVIAYASVTAEKE